MAAPVVLNTTKLAIKPLAASFTKPRITTPGVTLVKRPAPKLDDFLVGAGAAIAAHDSATIAGVPKKTFYLWAGAMAVLWGGAAALRWA